MNIQFKTGLLATAMSFMLAGAAYAAPDQAAAGESSTLLAQKTAGAQCAPSMTTEQLEKLAALKDKFVLDTAQEKAQLKVDRHQLFNLLSKPTVDKQEVLALASKIKGLKAEISDARINYLIAASEVLTPEQKEKMHKRFLFRSIKGGGFKHHRHGFARGKVSGKCVGAASHAKSSVSS